jgi:tetratricopeptide (TPR) repeat protein
VRVSLGTIASCCLAALVVIVLAIADSRTFEDAEYSPLYQATLKNAYSRFKESDKRVPAGRPDEVARDPGQELNTAPNELGPSSDAGSLPRTDPRRLPGTVPPATDKAVPRSGPRGLMPDDHRSTIPQPVAHQHGPHMSAGERYAQEREYEKAIAEFRLEVQEHPECALAQHRIGDMLKLAGKPEEAVAAWNEVLRLNPAYHCVHAHIGDVLAAQGKEDQAAAAYDKAIAGYREQIKSGGPAATSARYHLAKLLLDINRNATEALALAQQVVQDAPDKPMHHYLVARCLEATGRRDEAIAAIDKASQLDPSQAEAYRVFRERLTRGATSVPSSLGQAKN